MDKPSHEDAARCYDILIKLKEGQVINPTEQQDYNRINSLYPEWYKYQRAIIFNLQAPLAHHPKEPT
jgi:hypothetical protein